MSNQHHSIRYERSHGTDADELPVNFSHLLLALLAVPINAELMNVDDLADPITLTLRIARTDIERLVDAGCLTERRSHRGNTLELTPEGASISSMANRAIESILNEGQRLTPCWDSVNRTLSCCGEVVKAFRKPAPNQECLLAEFQSQGWPEQIEDPLSPVDEIVPEERLRETIKRLNRSINTSILRFGGDGTGRGVRWRIVINMKKPTIAPNRP